MSKIQILFTAFEADPFIKTGGLGDVAGSLPKYISTSKFDIRVFLPKLSAIPEKYHKKMEYLTNFNVNLGWRNQYCGLFRLKMSALTFYFLDNEYYFKRDRVYGEFDDGERVAFFSKAVLESVLHIDDFAPDIIHCNDWHTALVPVYLNENYRGVERLQRAKTVFTIHNLKFQGKFDSFMTGDVLGLDNTPAQGQLSDENGKAVNFLKGACIYSDLVTTVSPTYATEICTGYFGEGLDRLFISKGDKLLGILNGIDYKAYDPMTDKKIPHHYDASSLNEKVKNKLELQKMLGLAVDPDIPLFSVVSRLTEQKGLDLLTHIMPEIEKRKMQLAILGVGTAKYEEAFRWYAGKTPSKFSAHLRFDEGLSHIYYAGSDVLLMPSRFEPCGLSQMMAMHYGTLPIVRETGGLRDSVKSYNKFTNEGTGFSFVNFNAHELLGTIDAALSVWYDYPDNWRKIQLEAMGCDLSWKSSAKKYREIYLNLLSDEGIKG